MDFYIAIDPGEKTGISYYNEEQNHWKAYELNTVKDTTVLYNEIEMFASLYVDKLTVICESFVHQQRYNVVYRPIELIGVVKLVCEQKELPLIFQTSGYGLGTFSNESLKSLGMYLPGKKDANQASRHLIQYLTARKHYDLSRLKQS